MLTFINETIKKRIKPVMIFKRTVLSSDMKYYRLDYYSQDEKYCVLELFFNECSLVCLKPLALIGSGEITLEDRICMSVTTFDTKREYKKKLETLYSQKDIDEYFEKLKMKVIDSLLDVFVDNIFVNGVDVFLYPSSMVLVKYSINGNRQNTLVAFIDEGVVDLNGQHPNELKNEINKILLGGIYV